MLHDLRYSARLLARRPGFTAVALLSLALGLGGASITFGLVDGLVLKPFNYPDPSRLVTIGVNFPKMGDSGESRFIEALSPAEFLDIRGLKTLTRAQAFDLGNRHVSGGDQPERLFTALVLGDLFEPIGLPPALGRGFTAEELAPGGPRAAVISHRVWRSRFGADPGIVGRAIRVNGVSTTVVGVMPPELLDHRRRHVAAAAGESVHDWPRGARQFSILARIADGATLQQVNAELGALAARTTAAFGSEFKEYDGWRLTAAPWAEALDALAAAGGVSAARRDRVRAADRLRQSREPAAGAGDIASARDGRAHRARRGPLARGASTARRKPDARGRRLRARPAARGYGPARGRVAAARAARRARSTRRLQRSA